MPADVVGSAAGVQAVNNMAKARIRPANFVFLIFTSNNKMLYATLIIASTIADNNRIVIHVCDIINTLVYVPIFKQLKPSPIALYEGEKANRIQC